MIIDIKQGDEIIKQIEVDEANKGRMMHAARLRAEMLTRDTSVECRAVERRESESEVKLSTEEIEAQKREELIAEKEREILRSLAISQLEAEVGKDTGDSREI